MKKLRILALLLALAMVLSLAACGKDDPAVNETVPSVSQQTENPAQNDTQPDTSKPNVTEPEVTEPEVTEPEVTEPDVTVPDITEPGVTDPEPTDPEPTDPEPVKPVEVTPKKLTATVSGSYEIGDTLKTSDFTVKVTMSDGSVLTNPSGWTASSMKLTAPSNTITVTYKGISTTVTVKAAVGAINGMDVVKEAIKHVGLDYVSGGNSLTTGTDCSGFTKLIFAKFYVELPRTPSEQNKVGTIITAEEAKPGDLVVVTYEEGAKYDGHAGIYIGGGKMISADPDYGVCMSSVSSKMDYIRVYDNSYLGTDDDAYFECMEALIELGQFGDFRNVNVSWKDGYVIFGGSPANDGETYLGYTRLDLYNCREGYESMLEVWKSTYLATQRYIDLNPENDYASEHYYGYLNGQWYTEDQLRAMEEDGEISAAVRICAGQFYGAFWNSNATIKTGLGETVDLSTCPGMVNYSAIAKPGDPNEGKANLPDYDPDGSWLCAKGHRWETVSVNDDRTIYVRACWYCGYTVDDCNEVKDHQHQIEVTFEDGGYIEDSYVVYSCVTCGYHESYEVELNGQADHEHDYSYDTAIFAPTCSMDGFTLHSCICGASYRDSTVECGGHNYGKATTVAPTADSNGYDVKECKDCGHKHKDNYKEAP